MPRPRDPINRRQAMLGSIATLSAVGLAGCRGEKSGGTAADAEPAAPRTDVPIRIVWAGTDDQAETVRRGWSSVSDQSIEINVIPVDRRSPGGAIENLVDAAKKSDLLAAPLASIADLVATRSIVPMVGSDIEQSLEQLYPALRSGVCRYASEPYAMPIAATLPAVMGDASLGPISRWDEYDAWVKNEAEGRAGEPTAEGWAGTSLLWRAAGAGSRWLIDRETAQPLINEQAYVEALSQMVTTVGRYQQPMQTPSQIWTGILSGDLAGGICFPTDEESAENELRIGDLPGQGEVRKLLFDPFSTVMTLSANCRQTDVSKSFLNWISGGDGSRSVRRQLAPQSEVRVDTQDVTPSPYHVWSADQLQSPLTLPPMQMLSAARYYETLDAAVTDCLTGKAKPAEALASVADQWSKITQEVGVEKQLRAWRRAQGMRA